MASTKRTPATNERLQELRRRRDALLAVTPVRNQYTFEGTKYTKRGYDELLKKVESDIAQVEKELRPTVFETTEAEAKSKREITQETQKLRLDYNSVQARRKDIEKAIARATTVNEERNLQGWLALFNENERRLKTALDQYESGRRPQTVPQPIQLVAVDQMKKAAPAGPMAPEPGTTPQPAGSVGQVSQTGPIPASQREQPMRPTGAPSRMPTLEEVNRQRSQQGLQPLVVRNGQVVDPATNQVVPNVSTTPDGQPPATPPTIPPGGVGGGAVGGTTTGTVPPTGTQPAEGFNVPIEWEQAAREAYGVYYDVIKNIPELRDFVKRLMAGPELSDAEFQYQLSQTNWWKQTTGSARQFVQRQVTDPATLQTDIDNKKEALKQAALNRGLGVDDATLLRVATDQIKFGWSDQITLNYLGEQALGTTAGVAELRRGFFGQEIRETAAKYCVPLSDTTLNRWVADLATGQQTSASFEAYARDLAKNLFPALSNGFDRGLTFTDMTAPYAQYASQILEIPSSSIDFTQPKWAQAFTARNDKGEQMQMSYGEWADYLRSDPSFGWEFTDQAKSQAYSVAYELGRMFGRAG